MANQEMRTPLAEPLAPTTVADDQPCAKCGYNLRSLSVTGRCSECGLPVEASLSTILKPGLSQKRLRRALAAFVLGVSVGVVGPLLFLAFHWGLVFTNFGIPRGYGGVVTRLFFSLDEICGALYVVGLIQIFRALRLPPAGRSGQIAFYAWLLIPGYSLFLSIVGGYVGGNNPGWFRFLLFNVPADGGKPALWLTMFLLLWRLGGLASLSRPAQLAFSMRLAMIACFLLCMSAIAQPAYFRIFRDPLFENLWWRPVHLYYWSGSGRIEFALMILLLGSLLPWFMALRSPGRPDRASAKA